MAETHAAMTGLGWRPYDPQTDQSRWLAVRDRVPRLPETPRPDTVWLRDGATFVCTGWIGLVGLILEEPAGPIHELGSMGRLPPEVHAWAWQRGLSMAQTRLERLQTVQLATAAPERLDPIVAGLRHWHPDLELGADGWLRDVDLRSVWGLLYQGEVEGWLTLALG